MLGAGLALRHSSASRLPDETAERTRTYRADVVVTLLGVPIFARQAVGGAFSLLRETFQDRRKMVTLQFAGGANPERTHGIHYFGSIEEVIQEVAGEPVQAQCFGFVTARSQNQEGFEQARQRLMSSSWHPASSVIAVEEVVQRGRLQNTSATYPIGDFAWRDWPELLRDARSGFQRANAAKQETSFPSGATTFLCAVLSAARAPGRSSFYCFHNAKPYRLESDKVADRHAGGNFSGRNLTHSPQSVVRLTGQIHDLTKGHTATFKLWLDESSELPIRIEFSPRPYLRIALELDPAMEPLKRKEEACNEANSIFSGASGQR
jgi:hypothetical protein